MRPVGKCTLGSVSEQEEALRDASASLGQDQIDRPETAVSPLDAQWLAGVNRMAGADAHSATEAAARARTAKAMTEIERLAKRRADQQVRRAKAHASTVSVEAAAAAEQAMAAGAASARVDADAEKKRKAARTVRARQKYRKEKHQRELPERQALVDKLYKIIETEIQENETYRFNLVGAWPVVAQSKPQHVAPGSPTAGLCGSMQTNVTRCSSRKYGSTT